MNTGGDSMNKNIYVLLSGPDKRKFFNDNIKKELKKLIKDDSIISTLAADFNNYEKNDKFFHGSESSLGLKDKLLDINNNIKKINLIDNRTSNIEDKIKESNILFLMGGDPHLQMDYIIKYKELFTNKIMISISAGTMNLSNCSYYSKDDVINFSHFYKGLGFIDITIDPHFDINNSEQYNEALSFSKINPIIGLPNESCVVINDNIKFVGEHYIFDKGELKNEL